jgi:Flp pilus assembly protein TadG
LAAPGDIRRRLSIRSESGQSLSEVAILLPILCVLLLAIAEFGVVFKDYVEVSQAARVGARKASVSRKSSTGVQGAVEAAKRATKLDRDELDVSVTPAQPWKRTTPVTVRVSYPYSVDILGLVVKSGTMSFEATGRMQ